MSEDGLVEGAADIFQGVKKADDYHSEMNSAHYENWIRFSKIFLFMLPLESLFECQENSFSLDACIMCSLLDYAGQLESKPNSGGDYNHS